MTVRILMFVTALAAVSLTFSRPPAQAQEVVPADPFITATAQVLRVPYMRELWVGIAHDNVPAADLLAALREACDDTTAVAVLEAQERAGLQATPEERRALRRVALRDAHARLEQQLELDRRFTRIVAVGAFESSTDAVDLADSHETGVQNLVLIDPPVEDIHVRTGRMVGSDAILHSRSQAEFERDEKALRQGLSGFVAMPRVIQGSNRFNSLQGRIAEIYSHIRGYTLVAGAKDGTALARELADFDVVIVGELHGNPGAHRLQLEFLREYATRSDRKLALATEQFERDVQAHLDAFLAGDLDESEFIRLSRAWPNYADYRPMVELSREHGIPVLAANIPRPLAARIARQGVGAFDDFTEEEKGWSARELRAGPGAYRDKFVDTMQRMGLHGDRLDNMFAAQAIKDDTMAESIVDWLAANPGGRVLHINGTFHSEGGLGVPEKLLALNPELRVAIVSPLEPAREIPDAATDEWFFRVPATRQSPR